MDPKKEHQCECGGNCGCGGHHGDHAHEHNHEHGESCECGGECECGEDCRCEELENNWKRALADYKNLEKRVAEEREVFLTFANASLILRVLSVLDNLEMTSMHNDDEGLKMTIKEFKRILEEEGVKEINVDGKDFDSESMEAIEKVPGDENKVIEVLQKGYLFKNKVLRPARVKVGSGKE